MADGSHIEWTDATWNPVTGCSVVSPGCTNCYAMKLAGGRLQHHPSRAGLTEPSKAGPVWNGQVRLNAEWLDQPLRWTRPRRIFVCAHGDLFHEDVPDAWIDQVFAVMALAPQHTFQVLTKQAARMREYCEALRDKPRYLRLDKDSLVWSQFEGGVPKNIWLGVSAETDHWAQQRIPHLLETPAFIRFLSAEPLLGPIDLEPYINPPSAWSNGWLNNYPLAYPKHRLDWVIAGGESGRGARPLHPVWARQMRDQCAAAKVAFFFKQWGNWSAGTALEAHFKETVEGRWRRVDSQLPGVRPQFVVRRDKAVAGRRLDGLEHSAFPEAR